MYSGYRHVSSSFAYGTFTLSGLLSQNSSAGIAESIMRSEPRNARTPVWALSISLAATLEIDFSFSSSGYLDVSVHRVPFHTLWIGVWIHEVFSCGFPHSDIHGSMDICSSPWLFAAYHVFHRLLVPRHPPCALTTLTVAGTIESLDSLFPHWCIALHQRALCFFHFPISLLTMKFEFLWCLDSFPFLKMNSILILVWSFQGTSVFQKQYPVSATLLVLSTMPSKNVYS